VYLGKIPTLGGQRCGSLHFRTRRHFQGHLPGDDTVILLNRENGAVIKVEIALLSAEDQEYVNLRLEAEAAIK
jgi:hypothetical protein